MIGAGATGSCTIYLGPLCRFLSRLPLLGGPERVGFLIGFARGSRVTIVAYYAVGNLEESPAAFTADPLDVISAHKAAWNLGLDVVGVYHTHPCGPPRPSSRDLSGMEKWPLPWIIGGRSGELAAFRLREGRLEGCRLDCGFKQPFHPEAQRNA